MSAETLAKAVDLAVVVPCFRPRPGWGPLLGERFTAFAKAIPTLSRVGLILVHDDGPGNLSPVELDGLRAAVPDVSVLESPRNRGKGHALRRGVHAAGSAHITLYTDVDFPYTLESMTEVVACVEAHGGVAAGERSRAYYVAVPPLRRALSQAHRALMRATFRLPVTDSQAGLKAFDQAGRAVFLETSVDRFLVDLDFVARCRRRVPVRAVPVRLRPQVEFTDFDLGILRAELGNFVAILLRAWRLPGRASS